MNLLSSTKGTLNPKCIYVAAVIHSMSDHVSAAHTAFFKCVRKNESHADLIRTTDHTVRVGYRHGPGQTLCSSLSFPLPVFPVHPLSAVPACVCICVCSVRYSVPQYI